ncbi:hypothetical protein VTN77DRAFT_3424 [Rasamsonia byssochlamydoides]|uniref:uncharacterized protein n=1 Tax=Rasamsonia byssochlamydoides TaxID=89139 RepID=UPI003742F4A4
MMQFPSCLLALCLVGLAQSTAIPAADVAIISHDVTILPTTDVVAHNWTKVDVAFGPDSIPQTAVALAVLFTNAQIASYACAAGPIVCGIVAMSAVLVSFFTLFRASSGPAGTPNPVRRFDTITSAIHEAWLPTESCSTLCQLKAGAPHGTWTSIGKETPRPKSGATTKRDDDDDDDGIVATYFWEDDNEQAFDDFDQSQIQGIATDIADYMFDNDANVVCANLLDQDGAVNVGVMTIDNNNNDELGIIDAAYTDSMAYCLAGDPNVP